MGKNLPGASQCMQLGKNSHTSDTSPSPRARAPSFLQISDAPNLPRVGLIFLHVLIGLLYFYLLVFTSYQIPTNYISHALTKTV